ncbi:MAG: hypothetical protein Q8934_06120 [Bacillota bacterium]|nr:hypothetical protein [Bacillota bacterium]
MDKVTCLAYILYQSSKNQIVKDKAIELLNGDVTLNELKKSLQPYFSQAEFQMNKNQYDKNSVQEFAEKFMLLEV